MELLNSLRTIGKNLLENRAYNNEELEDRLDELLIQIEDMRENFTEEADLPEAKNIILLLREALNLYEEAIEGIISSLDNKEEETILLALIKAEEADDILCQVEELIRESKELFDDAGIF